MQTIEQAAAAQTEASEYIPEYIQALPDVTLKSIVAGTFSKKYRRELEWAKRELARRAA